MFLARFAAWNAGLFGSNASPASNSHVLVSGCLSPFALLETGWLCAPGYAGVHWLLVWPWARSMTMSLRKLTSHPSYAGMLLEGCLLLVGKKCSRPMGLNVLGGQEVRFSSTGCHRLMGSSIGRRGIGWWPRLTSGQMNSSMTSLAGLTTSGAGGQMRSGGSKGFMKHRRLPG